MTWRLTPAEVRRVLGLRVDFKPEAIAALKLFIEFGCCNISNPIYKSPIRVQGIEGVVVEVVVEAVYEYGKGNYKEALELLGPDFEANNFKTIGASDEQLDVFNEVWYVMLLNTGQAIKAIEVIGKRIKMREGVPFMWHPLG
ncbi:Conserved oligomeric Golgi complex subunit 4 [Camellia lanceoleosa]|uniref:Conserved oligomeric Golgi complex subunit 4 n=1 Tax=Camellia lanceoleosa TaxID=1840588 RepID=A0ACC0HTZ1_9ERIC|nr:Conserved oligomeric Golgi complex subunit 4 [Camellia lanceoleosa]